jgi:hypothetical protein
LGQIVQFGRSLLVGNTGAHPGHDLEAIAVHEWVGLAVRKSRKFAERDPQGLRHAAIDSDEIFGGDAHDGEWLPIHADGAPKDAGIAMKTRSP